MQIKCIYEKSDSIFAWKVKTQIVSQEQRKTFKSRLCQNGGKKIGAEITKTKLFWKFSDKNLISFKEIHLFPFVWKWSMFGQTAY